MYCITSMSLAQTLYDPLCFHCRAKRSQQTEAEKHIVHLGSPKSSWICRAPSLSTYGVHRGYTSKGGSPPLWDPRSYVQLCPAHAVDAHVYSFSGNDEFGNRRPKPGLCRASASTGGPLFSSRREKLGQLTSTFYWGVPSSAFNLGKGLRRLGTMRSMCVRSRAFNPRNGGGGGNDGFGRVIINLAGAGLLTYLTITGRLNWLFDAIFTLWLVSAVAWWFAERSLIKGLCPNCGGEFQVFEFSLKDEHRLCPYCSQPFRLENKRFVRDEPQFSNKQTHGFNQPFGSFGGFKDFGRQTSSRETEDSSGVIVDIEAEVRDKD